MTTPPSQAPAARRSRLPRGLAALGQYNYRLYFLGQTVSVMGSWMQSIGQAWLTLELTRSPFEIGVVGALQMTPTLLFSLFSGVLADRWPRRAALLVSQTVAMAQALALWELTRTGTIRLWHLYVLAALLGVNSCLDAPARQAFIMEMVGREDLPNAVALSSALRSLTRIAGPSLGGIIIAASGVDRLFLLNGLSYIAAIAALLLMRGRELHGQPRSDGASAVSAWRSLREGVGYVIHTPIIAIAVVTVGMSALFGSNFSVLLPVFASDVLDAGARGFGFLSAAFGAGSLLAALWIASGRVKPTLRGALVSVTIFGALEFPFAASRNLALSLALLAGLGALEELFVTLALTVVQLKTPDHLQGRVMSVNTLALDGTVPPGYLMIGALTSAFGAPVAMAIGAAGSLLVAAAGWLWHTAITRRGG